MTVFLNIIVPLMVTVLGYILLAAIRFPSRLERDKAKFEDYVERIDEKLESYDERLAKLEESVVNLRLHRAADTGRVNGG